MLQVLLPAGNSAVEGLIKSGGTTGLTGAVQRRCACGGRAGSDGECNVCRSKRLAVQRAPVGGAVPARSPSVVNDGLESAGHALDDATRIFMETRLGRGFGDVRVHTDARANAAADALDAQAYTYGRDIYFAAGQYAPESQEGRRLLAHELTHTIQQSANGPGLARHSNSSGTLAVDPDASLEREAEATADRVTSAAPHHEHAPESAGVSSRFKRPSHPVAAAGPSIQRKPKGKDRGAAESRLSLSTFEPANRGIIAALSYEQLKAWHDIIADWAFNKDVDRVLARHEARERSTWLFPNSTSPIISSDYLDQHARIESRRKFVDESQSRAVLSPSAILGADITEPQPYNVEAEARYRAWAVTHFSSKPLVAELTTQREIVSALEESRTPGLATGIPHVNLLWNGNRIKHTRGIVTWNDLMDITEFQDRYRSDVTDSPEMKALQDGIKQLDSHIQKMKIEHEVLSEANEDAGWVRHASEAIGAPDFLELSILRVKAEANPNDLEAQAAYAEKAAEAGNYPRMKDHKEKGPGIWHDPELQLAAAKRFLSEGRFELAVGAMYLCEKSTSIATTKLAGYQRRVWRGAGTAVKWLERAKTAGKIASAFTGGAGVVRAAFVAGGYSFAQEGLQQVVANQIDPSNKIDLKGLTKQAAIDGLAALFGGVTQGAFLKALTLRFGERLVVRYGWSEGAARTFLSAGAAATSSFYNVPAEIVLKKIIAGQAFPNNMAEVCDMIADSAVQSSLMDVAGSVAHANSQKAKSTTHPAGTRDISEMPGRPSVVESLAGREGLSFGEAGQAGLAAIKGQGAEPSPGPVQDRAAVEFVNQHPETIRNRNTPGQRHASVGGGHKIVEVPVKESEAPSGIGCELHSPGGPRVPCPTGMGTKEVSPIAEPPHRPLLSEMERLYRRPDLPAEVSQDVYRTLDRAVASGDYDPVHFSNMITKLRHMEPARIRQLLSTRVQINPAAENKVFHTPDSLWWGRMSGRVEIPQLEAALRGYGPSGGPTRRSGATVPGAIHSESSTSAGEHAITSLIGDPVPRQGLEAVLPSRGEVRDSATRRRLDIMVSERLHVVGAGFGAESATGVAHGSSFVNQFLQNRGVESLIRFLHERRPPGIRYVVHADVQTRPAKGDVVILERITYRVSAVEELPGGKLRSIGHLFEATIAHPQKIEEATRPRGKGDIQGIGLEVEPLFGKLAAHFGL